MFDFLFRMSDLEIFIFLSVATLSLSIIVILILKIFILHKLRYKDNTVIGSVSALIGLIYGILVGLMALYLLNNNDSATNAAQNEASEVTTLYRDSRGLAEPMRSTIQGQIKKYIHQVVDNEWPLMEHGQNVDNEGDFILEKITDELRNISVKESSQDLIVHDMLESIRTLYTAREQRIEMSQTELSPEIWEVIIIATILIIGINYLFRVNFYLHLIAVSVFSLMASCMLFLLVTLDRPFQGEFIVEPDALRSTLAYIEESTKRSGNGLTNHAS